MREGRDGRKGDGKEEEETEEEEKGGRQLTACSCLSTAIPALVNYFHRCLLSLHCVSSCGLNNLRARFSVSISIDLPGCQQRGQLQRTIHWTHSASNFLVCNDGWSLRSLTSRPPLLQRPLKPFAGTGPCCPSSKAAGAMAPKTCKMLP